MQIRKRLTLGLIPVALCLPLFHASATTLTYSGYPAWNAAVANAVELNLNGISSSGNYSTASGIKLFPSSGLALAFVFTGPVNGGYNLQGGNLTVNGRAIVGLFGPPNSQGNITITLPSGGENAFLMCLGSTTSVTATVALSDGETFQVAVAANAFNYLGLSISHEVNWITIAMPGQPVVDDFFFANSNLSPDAQVAPTAEGSTLVLLGGGLLALFGAVRKLRSPKLLA